MPLFGARRDIVFLPGPFPSTYRMSQLQVYGIIMSVQQPSLTSRGIHHIKIAAEDLLKTYTFYTTLLPVTPLPEITHRDENGEIFALFFKYAPAKLFFEIRRNAKQAIAQVGWDPVTWSVATRKDLDDWAKWFDQHGVAHSKNFVGMRGWLLVAKDPDGKFLRLYTDDDHEWTEQPDEDQYWLGSIKA